MTANLPADAPVAMFMLRLESITVVEPMLKPPKALTV